MARKRAGFSCGCGKPLAWDETKACSACSAPKVRAALKVVFADRRGEPEARLVRETQALCPQLRQSFLANGREVWVNEAGEPV